MMDLESILSPLAVISLPGISSKKRLFKTISERATELYQLDQEVVSQALQSREDLGSTGVGKGIAIPHAHVPKLDRMVGIFTKLERPVEYDAIDHQPVDLIFALLAPVNSGVEHLKALALVSRTLRDEANCAKLRANDVETILFTVLTEKPAVKAA